MAVIDVQSQHGPPHYSALGGTCVNVGCVPKKLLVTGAAYREHFKDAAGFGWQLDGAAVPHNWSTLMAAKDKVVGGINESYKDMFVDAKMTFVMGWGTFSDAHTVDVHAVKGDASSQTHRLTATTILVATGGWPSAVPVPGGELAISSNEAFYLKEAPRRVLIVGGGFIAVEFASIFQSFLPASAADDADPPSVTLCYRGDLFLRGFDRDVREELRDQMRARGIQLRFGDTPTRIELHVDGRQRVVHFASGPALTVDTVMFAIGRVPNTASLNLAAAGVPLAADGAVVVDAQSRTAVPHIFAIGDVTNRMQLTPVAIHEGQCFAETAFGGVTRSPDYDSVASAVFAIPQIGTVGLTEEVAAKKFSRVAVYRSRFTPLMHKISGAAYKGFLCKAVVDVASSRVLGVHLCGSDAAEIIQAVGIAVKMKATIQDFYGTIGVHPTSAEELCSMRTPSYFVVDGAKMDALPAAL